MPENRLAFEKSPYLLQHKENPVDWFAWSDEAFHKAKVENKPVYLSVGYSTCHWCHVMAHESFEDQEVAALLNENFISIKVDREERPDIDHIYMTVCQMMTGSGGWPLTIVMTPDKKPFFAGTYFPKTARNNRIGMMELMQKISEIWELNRDEINKSADEITSYLNTQEFTAGQLINSSVFEKVYGRFTQNFDMDNGGFGNAPKFPTPHNLLFLLRYYISSNKPEALSMVEKTLQSMRNGGIFDQIGYGFHRYSTDGKWLVPHFEKMLYDQAMLILAYTETYQITGNDIYKETAEKTIEYVLHELTSETGGFFSAEDADSEGVEGKFYHWTISEITQLLEKKDADIFISYFNLKEGGNFREEADGELTGKNIPHITSGISGISQNLGIAKAEIKMSLKRSADILFDFRGRRIRPHLDDKILTDWNGLMIAALSRAGRVFGNSIFTEAAEKSAEFILDNLFDSATKTLYHRYRDGEGGIEGNIDDYAFFIFGLLELYQADFDEDYLLTAIELSGKLENEFYDKKSGGFFFTSEKVSDLISRKKVLYDGAIPSGNSVHLGNLLDLFLITGKTEYSEAAEKLETAFSETVGKNPFLYTHFLNSVYKRISGGKLIISAGNKLEYPGKISRMFLPDSFIVNISKNSVNLIEKIPYLKNYPVENDKTVFYVCKNGECSLPSENIDEVIKML